MEAASIELDHHPHKIGVATAMKRILYMYYVWCIKLLWKVMSSAASVHNVSLNIFDVVWVLLLLLMCQEQNPYRQVNMVAIS